MLHADSAHRIAALLLAEEFDDLSAPPADAPRLRALAFLALFLAVALHAARDTGSLATSAPVPPRWTNPAQQDPTKRVHGMAHKNTLTKAAAAAALSIGSLATAQDAVQWRVEDGGNGHWYARNHAGLTWAAAHSAAVLMGGGLATTTSAGELAFIRTTLLQDGFPCWLGGTIDCSAVGEVCCTGCVWRWTSGEPFDVSWTGWIGDNAYTTERLVTNGVGFDDMCSPCAVIDFRPPSIIEWSADCNNDGIVDFGQIRAGELADVNGNFIPDICDSDPGRPAPTQWRAESGGNGHWYEGVPVPAPISWSDARVAAEARGGHLATITSSGEDLFVASIALSSPLIWAPADRYGPWLGGYQPTPSSDPFANWAWVTGEPWSYVSDVVQFDNSSRPDGQRDDYLHYIDHTRIWNDVRNDGDTYYGIGVRSYMIEWSADCNNDGLVDFGQIRAGELDDANGNNIPDCCEGGASCNCPGDVIPDGVVDGVDLAAVLGQWGSAGDKSFSADANGDGTVDAGDLSIVLNGWGACP